MNLPKFLSFNKPNKSTIDSAFTYLVKSFTYYLPAPPKRRSGYREKQFDKIFNTILSQGFAVETVNTVAHTSANGNGVWLHFILRPLNEYANNLDLDQLLMTEEAIGAESLAIEGLYPLNDN